MPREAVHGLMTMLPCIVYRKPFVFAQCEERGIKHFATTKARSTEEGAKN
jgi:hypothetical protein